MDELEYEQLQSKLADLYAKLNVIRNTVNVAMAELGALEHQLTAIRTNHLKKVSSGGRS